MAAFRLPVLAAAIAVLAFSSSAGAVGLDALGDEQWAIAPGSILNLQPAWDLSQGAGVTVAVVDSGILAMHRDLAPNLWTNTREIPGNRVDDDRNGYIDDVHGVDLTSADPYDQTPDDENGHGTHVSGIIAGARNGQGIVGIAPKAKVMAVKVLDGAGRGTTDGVAAGVRYATANGARIINMSLNGPSPSQALTEAISAACAASVLVVVSAGNDGRDIDAAPSYPASTPAPCLVGVAATAPGGGGKSLAAISNYGRLTVGLAAPGEDVLSTAKDGEYESRTGTSMAAPHVAGVAALMRSVNPALSAAEVRGRLLSSADRSSLPVNAGYLDAFSAVRNAAGGAVGALGQPPSLKVLDAIAVGRAPRVTVTLQVGVTGSRAAISRYEVRVKGRRVAVVAVRRSDTVNVRLRSRTALRSLTVTAIGRDRRKLASASAKVKAVKAGPKRVAGDKSLGTTGARDVTIG